MEKKDVEIQEVDGAKGSIEREGYGE